ncbi:hypothetical protein D9758_013139 [Tetrapyrgos nigripes]|uniref:Uncharacterized protein n=1 Tax=Tetrapyrgos nigripes TaxID=182062 RepID=A0A8H5CF54_9AGAR|nr:hypothetical protein D9758_013139 [Tetrapyrgos nigripes]
MSTQSAHRDTPSVDETEVTHDQDEDDLVEVNSTVTGTLKKQFAHEYRRHGSTKERRSWIKKNTELCCTACIQANVPCIPSQDFPRCQTCKTKKRSSCSRVAQERKERLMSVLDIDETTFEALHSWYEKSSFAKSETANANGTRKPRGAAAVATASTAARNAPTNGKSTANGKKKTVPQVLSMLKLKTKVPESRPAAVNQANQVPQQSRRVMVVVDSAPAATGMVKKPKPQPPKPSSIMKPRSTTESQRNHVRAPPISEPPKIRQSSAKPPTGRNHPASQSTNSNHSSSKDRVRPIRKGSVPAIPAKFRDLDRENSEEEEEEEQGEGNDSGDDGYEEEGQRNHEDEVDYNEVNETLRIKQEMINDQVAALSPTAMTRTEQMKSFIQLHVYKRKLELGMRQVPPGSALRDTLGDVVTGLGNLASVHLDAMALGFEQGSTLPSPKSSQAGSNRRPRSQVIDDEIDEIDELPERKGPARKKFRKEVRFSRIRED